MFSSKSLIVAVKNVQNHLALPIQSPGIVQRWRQLKIIPPPFPSAIIFRNLVFINMKIEQICLIITVFLCTLFSPKVLPKKPQARMMLSHQTATTKRRVMLRHTKEKQKLLDRIIMVWK